MAAVPYKKSGDPKKKQIAEMFNKISSKYDFLNHALSFNIDKLWRWKTIRLLKPYAPQTILDVATGTADFAIAACDASPERIIGIDIAEEMLRIGNEKIHKKGLDSIIELQLADSENLPFKENMFDAAIAAFGVRNFESLEAGLSEIMRVLKVGGRFFILEFSKPESVPVKQIYQFYFRWILPFIGRVISKDKSAYTYLYDSVSEFPSGKSFTGIMGKVGFINNVSIPLTFGIASVYIGEKPDDHN